MRNPVHVYAELQEIWHHLNLVVKFNIHCAYLLIII